MTETKKKPIDDKFRQAFPESTKVLEEQEKKQKENVEFYKMEISLLEKSLGKRVDIQLSRGSNVRGIVTALDQKYGKIAVKVNENSITKTTVVRLSYVVSFSVYE